MLYEPHDKLRMERNTVAPVNYDGRDNNRRGTTWKFKVGYREFEVDTIKQELITTAFDAATVTPYKNSADLFRSLTSHQYAAAAAVCDLHGWPYFADYPDMVSRPVMQAQGTFLRKCIEIPAIGGIVMIYRDAEIGTNFASVVAAELVDHEDYTPELDGDYLYEYILFNASSFPKEAIDLLLEWEILSLDWYEQAAKVKERRAQIANATSRECEYHILRNMIDDKSTDVPDGISYATLAAWLELNPKYTHEMGPAIEHAKAEHDNRPVWCRIVADVVNDADARKQLHFLQDYKVYQGSSDGIVLRLITD